MAGMYIHIPFCRQACHYCDFHFSTTLHAREALVDAISREIVLRKDYMGRDELKTIYFGGGTPSLLNEDELRRILTSIHRHCKLASDMEITIEANPEDINTEKLMLLKSLGFNRLSIGVQSFCSSDLILLNRNHTGEEALSAIEIVKQSGFGNFSIDLMFGIPGMDTICWEENLHRALAMHIPHISCYSLTVESGTALRYMINKNRIPAPAEDAATEQFQAAMRILQEQGYLHYEISNYCLPGHISRHNSAYWKNACYLGIGPSAHSYDGKSRCWNVSGNHMYIKAINKGILPLESEELTPSDKLNEYIMTGLRTMWGLEPDYIKSRFGQACLQKIMSSLEQIGKNNIIISHNAIRLSDNGKLHADSIASALFQ